MTSPSKTYKLYELERDRGIKILGFNGEDGKPLTIVFGHLDGMYSYCWLENETDKIVHLSASTPLKKIDNTTYEVADDGES